MVCVAFVSSNEEVRMATWFQAAILAIGIAATAAVGMASAAMVANATTVANASTTAPKGDRLAPPANAALYQTIEIRGAGISTLARVQSH
jgi:hypothetical protein